MVETYWLYIEDIVNDPEKIEGIWIYTAVEDWAKRRHSKGYYDIISGGNKFCGKVFTNEQYQAACNATDTPDWNTVSGQEVRIWGQAVPKYHCEIV